MAKSTPSQPKPQPIPKPPINKPDHKQEPFTRQEPTRPKGDPPGLSYQ